MRIAHLALAGAMALAPLAPLPLITPAQAQQRAPESFAPLARELLPAVVNISTSKNVAPRAGRPNAPEMPQLPPGSPFEEFFRDFFNRNRPPGQGQGEAPQQRQRRAQSLGSGFIIDAQEGIVVTNNHVIDGADEINVILQDNTSIRAELVGTDPRTDIAVLRIKHDKPLAAVAFGNSDQSEVGDWVIAIGNPFGFGGTVTAGIVSARGRNIGQGLYDDFIQTDASINSGNSGGPLFNMRGQVIGINTAIVSPSGVSAGLGFSIPSNMASRVVAQLRDAGRVRRGWIGVNIQSVTDDIAEALRLPAGTRGALIANAQADGPAAKAGIRSGDVVIRFNGTPVPEMRALPRIVADNTVGGSVPVVIWRDGKEETVTVTLGELPAEQRQAAAPAAPPPGQGPVELTGLGLRVAAITDELRQRFSLKPEQRGVVIVEVTPGTPAAERELRPGDVIVEVQQQRVTTPAEVQEQIERLRRQDRNVGLFAVENASGQRFVPLRLNARGNAPG